MTTVKLVGTRDYEIEMVHLENGQYEVIHTLMGKVRIENFSHYEIASAYFDKKVEEFEKLRLTENISSKH